MFGRTPTKPTKRVLTNDDLLLIDRAIEADIEVIEKLIHLDEDEKESLRIRGREIVRFYASKIIEKWSDPDSISAALAAARAKAR